MKPSQDKMVGRSKVIELKLTIPTTKKIRNKRYLFVTFTKIKLMMEHIARKCNIPKKIKLFLSIKKVAAETIAERMINLKIRLENLALKFFEKVRTRPDIPAIVIKLIPIT